MDPGEQVVEALFKPLEFVDGLMATTAVRARYLKELRRGASPEEAIRLADKFGREVMGSRLKGEKPLGFEAKNLLSQMAHMFQIETMNAWEHISQDLPREFRDISEKRERQRQPGTGGGACQSALDGLPHQQTGGRALRRYAGHV
jgi:hypothetical protein